MSFRRHILSRILNAKSLPALAANNATAASNTNFHTTNRFLASARPSFLPSRIPPGTIGVDADVVRRAGFGGVLLSLDGSDPSVVVGESSHRLPEFTITKVTSPSRLEWHFIGTLDFPAHLLLDHFWLGLIVPFSYAVLKVIPSPNRGEGRNVVYVDLELNAPWYWKFIMAFTGQPKLTVRLARYANVIFASVSNFLVVPPEEWFAQERLLIEIVLQIEDDPSDIRRCVFKKTTSQDTNTLSRWRGGQRLKDFFFRILVTWTNFGDFGMVQVAQMVQTAQEIIN